jgi:hypothetical protein
MKESSKLKEQLNHLRLKPLRLNLKKISKLRNPEVKVRAHPRARMNRRKLKLVKISKIILQKVHPNYLQILTKKMRNLSPR